MQEYEKPHIEDGKEFSLADPIQRAHVFIEVFHFNF